jgi:hypothetical protein
VDRDATLFEVQHREGREDGGWIDSPLDLKLLCTEDEVEQLAPEEISLPIPEGAFDTGHGRRIADCMLLESDESDLQCLANHLAQLDGFREVLTSEILRQAGAPEGLAPEADLAEWTRFRDHLCQGHPEMNLDTRPEAVVEMRCGVEVTEA